MRPRWPDLARGHTLSIGKAPSRGHKGQTINSSGTLTTTTNISRGSPSFQ